MRAAISRSTRVADVVASVSLIVLKPSRSRKTTATPVPWRRWRASAPSMRSSSRLRFGSRVSMSWLAWWARRSSSARRSVMSRVFSTIPDDGLVVEEVGGERLHGAAGAVAVEDAVEQAARRARHEIGEERADGLDVARVHDVGPRPVQAVLRDPQQACAGGAEVADAAVGVQDAHDVGRVADERGEPLLVAPPHGDLHRALLGPGRAPRGAGGRARTRAPSTP